MGVSLLSSTGSARYMVIVLGRFSTMLGVVYEGKGIPLIAKTVRYLIIFRFCDGFPSLEVKLKCNMYSCKVWNMRQ